jgi:anti-anti-sigma regulatory factor
MEYQKTGNHLSVRLVRDFNLFTARQLGPLVEDAASVRIDLGAARIVNSEAVRLLYAMVRAGKRVTLVTPPPILADAIDILGLSSVLDVNAMTEAPGAGDTHDR